MFDAPRLALDRDWNELDHELRPGISDGEERAADGLNDNVEFFGQFPLHCVLKSLARFHFASRKLPEAAVTLICRPLADEISLVALNDGSENDRHWEGRLRR